MRRLSASQTQSLGTRLTCLPTWLSYGASGGVRSVSTWCSMSVHIVHVVADQEHKRLHSTTVPVQVGTGMEICNANCENRWIVPLNPP